jgi:hypothetical protein
MGKSKQFKIIYQDHDDGELYTIIQVAPTQQSAIIRAQERLEKSGSNFLLLEMEELGTEAFIRQIRRTLISAIEKERERNMAKRPTKDKKKENSLKTFEIVYTRSLNPGSFVTNVEAHDKYNAIMKFNELYKGARIKNIEEVKPQIEQESV